MRGDIIAITDIDLEDPRIQMDIEEIKRRETRFHYHYYGDKEKVDSIEVTSTKCVAFDLLPDVFAAVVEFNLKVGDKDYWMSRVSVGTTKRNAIAGSGITYFANERGFFDMLEEVMHKYFDQTIDYAVEAKKRIGFYKFGVQEELRKLHAAEK